MSDELWQIAGAQKIIERGKKYYQVIIARFVFWSWEHRILCKKCRTMTQAKEYGRRVIDRLSRMSMAEQPRAKKGTRFS